MKKAFIDPELDVLNIEVEDILTTSGGDGGDIVMPPVELS